MNSDDPRLSAYALNELTPRQRAEVECELDSEPELYGEVNEIMAVGDLLTDALTSHPFAEHVSLVKPLPDKLETRSRFGLAAGALVASAACIAVALYSLSLFNAAPYEQMSYSRKMLDEKSALMPLPASVWENITISTDVEYLPESPQDEQIDHAEQQMKSLAEAIQREPAELLIALRKHASEANLPPETEFPILREQEYRKVTGQVQSDVPVLSGRASYPWIRRYIGDDLDQGSLPPREAVRIEELVNAFPYDEPRDAQAGRVASGMRLVSCPWDNECWLLGILLKNSSTVDDVEVKARLSVRSGLVREYRLLGFAQPKVESAVAIPRVLPAGESQFVIYQLRKKKGAKFANGTEVASLTVRSRLPKRSWDNARISCKAGERPWAGESEDFRFATLMSAFGEALREKEGGERAYQLAEVDGLADDLIGSGDGLSYPQREAVNLIRKARELSRESENK